MSNSIMKRFLSFVLLLLVTFEVTAQQGLKYSQYPRVTTLDPRYLLLSADPGITNYAILWSDLQLQITKLSFTNASVLSTNIFTTNLFATTVFTTNLYGPFITNFLEYSTNLFVTTNNTFTSFTTNLFATTEFVTNITAVTEFVTNLTATTITNNTFITTNVTIQFPGGVTNLNLTPNSVMYSDINDSEASIPNAVGVLTNNGAGGVGFTSDLQFDEIDADNLYATNLFTSLTNSPFLMTDGDGKIVAGVELPGTNVLLSAGANITFTTNGSGGISIAGTSTNVIDTSTNNLVVVTNVIVYSNLTVLQNIYVSTNFSTNLYSTTSYITNLYVSIAYITNLYSSTSFITNLYSSIAYITNLYTSTAYITNLYSSTAFVTNLYSSTSYLTNLYFQGGKGNTLIITNNLNLDYLVNSKLVATDGAKNITNADVSARFTFTGNVLDIASGSIPNADLQNNGITIQGSAVALGGTTLAAGSAPFFDLSSSTNLIYRYTTNAVTGLTLTFGKEFFTNVSTANITFTAINAKDVAAMETVCLRCTNSSGSDFTVTLPNGIGSPGLGKPPVITITNKQECRIFIQHDGNQSTNCWFIPTY